MSTVTLPQARIPIGHATVGGQKVDVLVDIEWMRAFLSLVDRTGGTTGTAATGSTQDDTLIFLMEQLSYDPLAKEAMTAIDELRNELTSTRGELQQLRGLVEELNTRMD